MGRRFPIGAAACLVLALAAARPATAEERLCDVSHENCRTTLLALIDNERVGIDVGVWFIKDGRYPNALVRAHNRGVPIRIIMDPRANTTYPTNAQYLKQLADAGIPMRKRTAGDICHWKLMIFAGQGTVEWSGANFSEAAFLPYVPYQNYEDEVIYFSDRLVPSFMRKFDDIWTNTTSYANYANISGPLVRKYPTYTVDGRLNFPPTNSYQDRLVPLIDREPRGGLIDVDMYRLTMARPVDALIRAAARGVRQRLYFEPKEYSNIDRPGNKVQIDRLVNAAQQYPGTIEIRMRAHEGINHQKTVWLHAQRIVVFGTSNWSSASDDNQLEANIFTDRDPGDGLNEFLFSELNQIFERKFYNDAPDGSIETTPFRTPSLPRPYGINTCNDPSALNYGGEAPCTYPAPSLPSGWETQDVGSVGLVGSAAESGGTYTVRGAGADVWGTSDDFRYVYRQLSGDGTIVARVASVENVYRWTKAGVMIRQTLSASSAHASMFVTPGAGLAFQRRKTAGATSLSSAVSGLPPRWVRLVRAGEVITASISSDGASWTDVGQDTIALSGAVWVGLAVTSHETTRLATATFDHLALSTETSGTLPSGWGTQDVGSVGLAGSATESGGTYTIAGAGVDIWGTTDGFRYVYRQLAGDGTIVARVASVENVYRWTKAGVMVRQTLSASSAHASMFVTPGAGLAFQRRQTTGAISLNTAVGGLPPRWVRLVRVGQVITASISSDGLTWTNVGQDTIALSGAVWVGLAVTSHETTRLATATFDQVTITP